jgi:hypothetical protein
VRFPEAFAAGSRLTNLPLAGTNTAVLLTSSLTMALGVHAARHGARRALVGWLGGSGASADNSLRSAAEALKGTLVSDGKRLEIRHFCFAACGSSIRQEVFAGPKSLDAPEPFASACSAFSCLGRSSTFGGIMSSLILSPSFRALDRHRTMLGGGDCGETVLVGAVGALLS